MTDAEVVAAMAFLFKRLKAVVEPSRTGALAGGNVSPSRFCDLVSTA